MIIKEQIYPCNNPILCQGEIDRRLIFLNEGCISAKMKLKEKHDELIFNLENKNNIKIFNYEGFI